MACSLRRDGVLTTMSSSIILHSEDKANYFGLVLKTQSEGLVLARPEGVVSGDRPSDSGGGGPGAKPILLREPCDLCDGEPWCVRICPTGAILRED
jgi:ferredoxin